MLRSLRELDLSTLRAASWAVRALRRVRREIPGAGLEVRVLAPPTVPTAGVRGVEAALRLRRATCLERSLIVQRWLAAHGDLHDVLVGVSGGSDLLAAHAWIGAYDEADEGRGYQVLTRVAPSREQ